MSFPYNDSAVTQDVLRPTPSIRQDFSVGVKRVPFSLFSALYGFIFLTGLLGNILIILSVSRNKTMRTITNIFIINLAVADILLCLLAVPFTPLSGLSRSWVFGKGLCHLVPTSLGVAVHVSALTCMVISIDRYYVIIYPFKPRMRVSSAVAVIIAVWIIAITLALPLALYRELSPDPDDPKTLVCVESWPKPSAGHFYTLLTLTLQCVIPCSVITFCYSKVSMRLNARSKIKVGAGIVCICSERVAAEIRCKRKINRMLISMTVMFIVCWLPLNLIHLISEYREDFILSDHYLTTFLTCHVIAMSSTVFNPLIYGGMNEAFQKEFKSLLTCLKWCRGCPSRRSHAIATPRSASGQMLMSEYGSMRSRNGRKSNVSGMIEMSEEILSDSKSPIHQIENKITVI